MGLSGMAFLFVSMIFFILALRNVAAGAVKNGIALGWVAMAGFAAQSLFLLWLTRKLRTTPGSAEASASAMKVMVGHLVGLLIASYGIGVQRRKRRPAAPQPDRGPDLS